MDALERFWAHDDLPFNPNINEADVLNHIINIPNFTQEDCARIRQWIKFNKWCNLDENTFLKNWLQDIYDRIHVMISTIDTSDAQYADRDKCS